MTTISYSFRDFWEQAKKNRLAYYYILPAFVIMGIVVIYPFIYNIVLSFSNMNLARFQDWSIVGLKQYIRVFTDPMFYTVLMKTLVWTAINLVFHVTLGVGLALILNNPLRGRAIFRTLLVLPWAVPQYITALTWRGMFNYRYGAVNLWLMKITPFIEQVNHFLQNLFGFGFGLPPYEWLSSPVGAFSAAIITNIWLGFPFMMIVALGALQSIPPDLYEVADIDGASRWQKFRHITVPLIKPAMIPAITLGVIWTFNNFNVIWLVSNGGNPSDSTHILVSYVYKAVFTHYRYAYSAALSIVIFLILLIFGINFIRKTHATESVY